MATGGALPSLFANAVKGVAVQSACAAVFTGVWQAAAVPGCDTQTPPKKEKKKK